MTSTVISERKNIFTKEVNWSTILIKKDKINYKDEKKKRT